MAELIGYLAESNAELSDDSLYLAAALQTLDKWDYPQLPQISADALDCTSCPETNNLLVSVTHQPKSAYVNKGFSQDWYETVHLIPGTINLGNLLSNQERTFEVWNAYTAPQNLSSISSTGTSGLSLTQPSIPPTDFEILESRIYTLSISTSGQSSINAEYTFNFPSDSPSLSVTGTRVIPFVFQPNWSKPFTQTFKWSTEVFRNYDGSEQRVKKRQNPRLSYDYNVILMDDDKSRFDALIWSWQTRVLALPIWTDYTQLTSAVSSGDTTINVPTDGLAFSQGGLALIIDSVKNYEIVEILSKTSTTLVASLPVQNNWVSQTIVIPMNLSRLGKEVDKQLLNSYIMSSDLSFDMIDQPAVTPAEFGTTYRGLPLLDSDPYWHKPISTKYRRDLEVIDNSSGIRTYVDQTNYSHTFQEYHWVKQGKDDINQFISWLFSRQGKLVEFWTCTFQSDLTLYDLTVASSNLLKINNIGYSLFQAGDVSRKDIRITLHDGTVYYRRIESASEVDSNYEQLTLDSAIPNQMNPSDVRQISFMYLARLDTDSVELYWRNPRFLEVSATVRGLNYDV